MVNDAGEDVKPESAIEGFTFDDDRSGLNGGV